MKVTVIGVAGGTGSGKSTLVKRLQEAFEGDDVVTLCHDYYYKAHPALWSQDFDPAGFQWLTSDDADHNTLSFLRIGTKGETLAVVVNFSGEAWSDYQVALPTGGKWTEVFTTDDAKYGGSDIHNGTFEAVEGEYHSRPVPETITVPALGVVFLKPED